jgi:DNA ligase-1
MAPFVKPMLAAVFDPACAQWPYLATPKIDGIRFLKVKGQAVSRTFKPIRNAYIQESLALLPDGVDGELTCGDTFQSCTSGIMSSSGKPEFKAWLFDYVDPEDPKGDTTPYVQRIARLDALCGTLATPFSKTVLLPVKVNNAQELEALAARHCQDGFEGTMLRSPDGPYKAGRSTVKQNTLLKVKAFTDAEARVIGFVEKQTNTNEAQEDAFGLTKRSSHKEGKQAAGTLGALVVASADGVSFNIGTGFTAEQRDQIWANQATHMGQMVKYKYFDHGVKDKPRHPVFLGWRHPDDM